MTAPETLTLSSIVIVPAQVMAREVGGETVILDLASGSYFGLDPIGTRIWQLMVQGQSLAQVCEVVVAEYEVTLPQIEQDLLQLVGELREAGLVTTAGQQP